MDKLFKHPLRVEWDAIAGIVAALVALIMPFLHVLEINVLLMIFVVLLALLFIRDLRREQLPRPGRLPVRDTDLKMIALDSDAP